MAEAAVALHEPVRVCAVVPQPELGVQAEYVQLPVPPVQAEKPDADQL